MLYFRRSTSSTSSDEKDTKQEMEKLGKNLLFHENEKSEESMKISGVKRYFGGGKKKWGILRLNWFQ